MTIPFGSQRGDGPNDLGPHVQNTLDNLEVEHMEVRGTVARDIDGWMREIEAQAFALTKCTNYLYSLSVNPDERGQGRWTREMYFEYIDRCEERFGLTGQPRLVVRHVKADGAGIPREHYHAIWSRIDAERHRAIHMFRDHDTLMMVTREFARDHDLRLPEGYDKQKVVQRKRREYQMAWHDKAQQDRGGLPLEARKAQVTAAWERRDTPRSFVRALEDMGYTLATGRRDYVLVDMYRFQKSLPKLIDDKKVRIAQVREFLAKDFPKDSLPSVEEALALAKVHRAARDLFEKNEQRAAREAREKHRREQLQIKQHPRRRGVERDEKALSERLQQARQEFSARQWGERAASRQSYLQESRRIKNERAAHRPTGLAAFLGRITGVEMITKKVQQFRDRSRYAAHVTQVRDLKERQQREARQFERRQTLERLAMERRLKALELIEQRERKSLEVALLKERRIEDRERQGDGRAPEVAVRSRSDIFNEAATKVPPPSKEAERAKDSGDNGGETGAGSGQGAAPEAEISIQRRRRMLDRQQEPEPSSRRNDNERADDDPSSENPPRRRRDRDFGPDR